MFTFSQVGKCVRILDRAQVPVDRSGGANADGLQPASGFVRDAGDQTGDFFHPRLRSLPGFDGAFLAGDQFAIRRHRAYPYICPAKVNPNKNIFFYRYITTRVL